MPEQVGIKNLSPIADHSELTLSTERKAVAVAYAHNVASLMTKVFEKIDDTLFDLANNAHTSDDQYRFFEAMREIRLKKRYLQESVEKLILQSFDPSVVHTTLSTSINENSDIVTSVNPNVLEIEIATADMSHKANATLNPLINDLANKVSTIFQVENPETRNPFSPVVVARSISLACRDLDIELTEKLLLLKHVDKWLMPELRGILEAANEQLEGVITHPDQASRAQTENTSSNKPLGSGKNISLQLAIPQKSSKKELGQRDHLETRKLFRKAAMIEDQSAQSKQQLRSILGKLIGKSAAQTTSDNTLKTFKLVAMLFEFILNDKKLAPQMQGLIAKLQRPILNIVLNDPSFFSIQGHPARLYLNDLARACFEWNTRSKEERETLLATLSSNVSKACRIDTNHLDLFSQLNSELADYFQSLASQQKLTQQRLNLAAEGEQRSAQAESIVKSTLNNLIQRSGKPLPQAVEHFLNNSWSRVMFATCLRTDLKDGWENTVRIAEELIWCSNHHSSDMERQRWVATMPKLLKDIEREVANLSFASSANEIISPLRETLATLFREHSIQSPKPARKILSANESLQKQNNSYQVKTRELRPNSRSAKHLAETLHIGQWVEINQKETGPKRYRLSAYLEASDLFVFVDRSGHNAFEKSSYELDLDFRSGKLRLLRKAHLIDRTLNLLLGR